MRIVVFDRELHEPITVLDCPNWLAERAKEGQRIIFAAPLEVPTSYAEVVDIELRTCSFTFERVVRGGARGSQPETLFWYAYADNPTIALELRAAFLPGQLGEVQRQKKEAYFRGMLALPMR